MKRSNNRILTTHPGRLPNPDNYTEIMDARRSGDQRKFDELTQAAIRDMMVQVVQSVTSSGLQPSFYTSTTTVLLVLTLGLLLAGAVRAWDVARAGGAVWRPALMFAWLLVPAAVASVE